MIVEIKHKGKLIDKKDIKVTWSDCFGKRRVDSLEEFIRKYTNEQVTIEIAGEGWKKNRTMKQEEKDLLPKDLCGSSIMDGIIRTDEHPKHEMLNKQEFIEKTWQWLKAHIKFETITYSDIWDTSVVNILATDFTTFDEMEESFRKIMEE